MLRFPHRAVRTLVVLSALPNVYVADMAESATEAAAARPLAGKAALITGASGGLGSAIARRLSRDGARVVVHYNSRPDPAESLVSKIKDGGGEALAHGGNLAEPGKVVELFDAAEQAFGTLDIVIANAGVSAPR